MSSLLCKTEKAEINGSTGSLFGSKSIRSGFNMAI